VLRLGSLNGNLTGMAFPIALWHRVGPFREDWRHAADWEWLARAAAAGPVLLNRTPIAAVRTHDAQLSDANRRSGHELPEVAAVVAGLRRDLAAIDRAAGLTRTALALLAWLPERWRLYRGSGSARLTRVSPSTLSSS
jgi:hypothetical protein